MKFELREYQSKFVSDLSKAVAVQKHVIGQSPGGTGKTPVLIQICRNANNKNRAAIILTERVKVFQQALKKSGGIAIGNGIKHVKVEAGKTYVCMAQTLARRPLIIEAFNNLEKEVITCVDECHIGTFSSVLNKLTNRMTIGFTATPDFKIAKHLPVFYNDIVCTESTQWFIDNGFLCDYQHIQRKSGKAAEKLEKKNGEFSESSQRKFFGTEEHYQELFTDLASVEFNKCMVFTASIAHAEEVYERMTREGLSCSIAHSKRPDEPFQLAKFDTLNQTNILISVSSLTTGYDYPEVDLIILYRATTSLAIYLQMLFRADRPKEGMFFRCLDYGSNFDRHKAYFHDHPWKEMWNKNIKKKKSEGASPMILCPKCESMIFVAARVCKWCGHELPAKPVEHELGVAEDVTNRLSALQGKRLSQLTPRELALYANIANKKNLGARIARARESREEGFLKQYGNAMGYKQNWAYIQREMPNNNLQFQDYKI